MVAGFTSNEWNLAVTKMRKMHLFYYEYVPTPYLFSLLGKRKKLLKSYPSKKLDKK
ncbi:neuronal acetylcholine receptor subunit alpha-10-like isoform X2 [Streptococcus ruminantium]|uniref:Neuronal acetylcholine receptor subunit alpha-10-like isoform X2 n=1 Tax=Streptococcus ruminantium TaxID=1917441 RepID=A0A2Z5TVB5_9STRE|nr:neuronal acetylcholine receptor subunit alpha-10-like isoform X2 [Streptococcus ruminantium]